MLTWIGVGTFLTVVLSGLVSLGVGAILGMIGREVGELFESELWAVAPSNGTRTERP
jgi:hypothetical protein